MCGWKVVGRNVFVRVKSSWWRRCVNGKKDVGELTECGRAEAIKLTPLPSQTQHYKQKCNTTIPETHL